MWPLVAEGMQLVFVHYIVIASIVNQALRYLAGTIELAEAKRSCKEFFVWNY